MVLQEARGCGMENGGGAAAQLSPGEASLAWSTSSDGAKEHSGPKEISLAREQDIEKGLDKRVRGEGSSDRPRFLPRRRGDRKCGHFFGENRKLCSHYDRAPPLSWGALGEQECEQTRALLP